jgi:protein-S-isoprenylcysteine O-methyltransferase Ste14
MPTPLDTKIPPPVVMLLLCALLWWAARAFPETAIAHAYLPAIGAVSILLGLALDLHPAIQFFRARTTVNPMRPSSSEALVTSGIYRFTRNPMYLGQALILLGFGLWQRSALAFVAVPILVAYLTVFQILPEERALSAKFGEAYDEYRRRVRRWL